MTPRHSTADQDWFKSSRSANNAACVEVRFTDGSVGVRDSKDPNGPALAFGKSTWSSFLLALKGDCS